MPEYLGPVGSPLRPPKLYNTLYVWACANVLPEASISHSGAIASIKPTSLKEAVCFLFVTETGDFISAALNEVLHRQGAKVPLR